MPKERLFSDAHIAVGGDDLGLLKKMKVGSRVRIVLYGTLKGMSQSAEDVGMDTPAQGSLTVTVSKMNLASNSEVAELFDDDDV